MSSRVRLLTAAALGLGMALAGSAAAQTRLFIATGGYASAERRLEERGEIVDADAHRLLRRVEPFGDLADLIPDDDPLGVEAAAGGELPAFLSLHLKIDAEGRVSGCEVADPELPASPQALCDRVSSRIRMIPALDRSGSRVVDFYDLNIAIHDEDLPPPPRLELRALGYPPLRNYSPTVVRGGFGGMIAPAGAPESFDRPNATIEVRPDAQGELKCRLRSHAREETAFHARACEAALRGQFDFTGDNRDKTAHLLFFERNGQLAVLLPITRALQAGVPEPTTIALLRNALPPEAIARLRLEFWVRWDGRIADCMVVVSTGDDGQDFTACDRLTRQGLFTPTLDPFGRPDAQKLTDWAIPGQ